MTIKWSPRAAGDVEDAAGWIGRERRKAAVDWLLGIQDAVKRLEQFPMSGRLVPEMRESGRREIQYRGYRVIYAVRGETVEIVRVVHARRDLETVFRSPSPPVS